MSIANLTESLIRQNAALGAFEKGKRLYQSQSVKSLVERGSQIEAEVGSSILYQVEIEFDQNGIVNVNSNYHGDRTPRENSQQSWCRYTVAALLTCLYQPQLIVKKVPVQALLAKLNRDQFQALVENLIKFDRNLLEEIEMAAQFLLDHDLDHSLRQSKVEQNNEAESSQAPITESTGKVGEIITEDYKEELTEQLIEAIATVTELAVSDSTAIAEFTAPEVRLSERTFEITSEIIIEIPSEPTLSNDVQDFNLNQETNLEHNQEDLLTERLEQILPKISSHWENEVEQFISSIGELILQSKYLPAIKLIVPVIDTYTNDLNQWDVEDENSELDESMSQLDRILTEAWLGLASDQPHLHSQLQEQLQGEIERWQGKLADLDFSGYLEMTATALDQSWNYPPLLKVLAGEITDQGAWIGKVPYFGDRLAEIRLNILARAERWQEYLNFAAAEGQVIPYLTMLIELGEIEAAIDLSPTLISTPQQALAVAQKLFDIQSNLAIEKAVAIAQLGLKLDSNLEKYELAIWLAENTEKISEQTSGQSLEQIPEQNQVEIALAAYVIAFELKPSLTIYRKIIHLSDSELKPTILEILRNHPESSSVRQAKVEIFLAESLFQDAIKVADQISSGYGDFLVKQVMDAVFRIEPDWVIESASQRANAIMIAAKAKYYDDAIAWLKYVKKAIIEAKPDLNWHSIHKKLIQTHSRKRKLVELLQKI